MKFILNMARREIRASWRRLLFFFICIGIGTGSIVALRSMIQNANRAVTGQARELLTADVQLETTRPWTPEVQAIIDAQARPPLVTGRTETVEAPTIVRPSEESRGGALMVELKGIEPPFPLYGELRLAGDQPFDYALLENNGAIVAPLLLQRLSLNVGDDVKIGDSTFQIRGVLEREAGGGGGFRLGPRVLISRASLEQAGLTGFGSRARRRILLRTPEGELAGLVQTLRDSLGNNLVTVRSYRDSEQNLSEQFARAENYLSLAGLVILVLGGIGVSSVTRVFIEQKKRSIAILKCLGASARQITMTYLAQVVTLGLAGSLFGVVLARLALLFVSQRFAESLPAGMSYALSGGAVVQGMGLGVLISVLFSALPLLRVRHIKPRLLLHEAGAVLPSSWRDFSRWITGAFVVVGLVLLAGWQAGSIRVGFFFLGGLLLTAALLYGAAWLLILLVRRGRHAGTFALRQSINSLYRPGNQTRVIVMAVGLGAFLVTATQILQSNLVNEFDVTRRGNIPNLFLMDVQKDQTEGVASLIEQATGTRPELIPTVRARIVRINDEEIDLEATSMRRERGRLGREYVVTYRPRLEYNETVVDGVFWDETPASEPEISVEESMRGVGGLDLGGTVTFDIQGRKITARVTSVRRVDWRNSRTGFLVLFRPGALEQAPQTFIGAVDAPTAEPERSRFQRALVDRYPNIFVIDVADIVRSVRQILDNVTLAVTFIGGFVLLSGVLILVGSVAMTKFQRIYEAAVLKTLGAKRRVLLTILLAEYGLLGLVAGITGALASIALSYAIARYVLEIEWTFTPVIALVSVAATVALVMLVGALSSFDVLTRKPLSILRSQ